MFPIKPWKRPVNKRFSVENFIGNFRISVSDNAMHFADKILSHFRDKIRGANVAAVNGFGNVVSFGLAGESFESRAVAASVGDDG